MKKTVLNSTPTIKIGALLRYKNLTIFPIYSVEANRVAYQSMSNALTQQQLEITEASESGTVSTLLAKNLSDVPILLLDGEALIGAKQNRIVNASILLAPLKEALIPVSCTEKGRWEYTSSNFSDSGEIMSAKARYNKSHTVQDNLESYNGFATNQSALWADMETLIGQNRTHAPTRAMKDVFVQQEGAITHYLSAFPIQKAQKGLIVFRNEQLVGMDYISNEFVYRDLHEKLIKSHAIEAIAEEQHPTATSDKTAQAQLFIDQLTTIPFTIYESVGLGQDLRFEDSLRLASLLLYDQEVIHWSAFSKDLSSPKKRTF